MPTSTEHGRRVRNCRRKHTNKMKNSDRECCYTCNKRYYDMSKGEYCKVTGRPVKAWNDCDCNAHEWHITAGE